MNIKQLLATILTIIGITLSISGMIYENGLLFGFGFGITCFGLLKLMKHIQ